MNATFSRIELETANVYLQASGILRIDLLHNAEISLEAARNNAEACIQLAQGQPRPFLINALDATSGYTAEARVFLAQHNPLCEIRSAQAIVVNTLPAKLIANFYLNYNKPDNPGKVFEAIGDATRWLEHYL